MTIAARSILAGVLTVALGCLPNNDNLPNLRVRTGAAVGPKAILADGRLEIEAIIENVGSLDSGEFGVLTTVFFHGLKNAIWNEVDPAVCQLAPPPCARQLPIVRTSVPANSTSGRLDLGAIGRGIDPATGELVEVASGLIELTIVVDPYPIGIGEVRETNEQDNRYTASENVVELGPPAPF